MNRRQVQMVTAGVVLCVVLAAIAVGWVLWHRSLRTEPPALAATGDRADLLRVHKAARRLERLQEGKVLRSYRMALGFAPVGHKEREGDGRTPEGTYVIDWRNPQSKFHLSLHISYPDDKDRARAASLGVSPGGDIMIHGQPNGLAGTWNRHPNRDWTVGCIAVSNREMREIWSLVADGTPIVIGP